MSHRLPLGDILFSMLPVFHWAITLMLYTIRLGFECRLIIYVCVFVCLSICPAFEFVTRHIFKNMHWHSLHQKKALVNCYLSMFSFLINSNVEKSHGPYLKLNKHASSPYILTFIRKKLKLNKGYKVMILFW